MPSGSVTQLGKLRTGGIRAITSSNGRIDTKAWECIPRPVFTSF